MRIDFRDGGWYTCGCNGIKVEKIEIREDSTPIVYRTTLAKTETVNGNPYKWIPFIVALDARKEDAQTLLDADKAYIPNSFINMSGYLSRNEPQI